jgi:hypothetical protein
VLILYGRESSLVICISNPRKTIGATRTTRDHLVTCPHRNNTEVVIVDLCTNKTRIEIANTTLKTSPPTCTGSKIEDRHKSQFGELGRVSVKLDLNKQEIAGHNARKRPLKSSTFVNGWGVRLPTRIIRCNTGRKCFPCLITPSQTIYLTLKYSKYYQTKPFSYLSL